MLSQDALRRIETIDREQIEGRIGLLFDRWSARDVETVASYLSADVTFISRGSWAGSMAPIRGRDRVIEHLRVYAEALESIVSILHEIVIDGDRAVAHRTVVGRTRGEGRRYQCDFISFFRFRDGLVVEFSDYPDAAWRDSGAVP